MSRTQRIRYVPQPGVLPGIEPGLQRNLCVLPLHYRALALSNCKLNACREWLSLRHAKEFKE
jgi:hypothetical protein